MRPHSGLGVAAILGSFLLVGLAWYFAASNVTGLLITADAPAWSSVVSVWICAVLAIVAFAVGLLAVIYRFFRPSQGPPGFTLTGVDPEPVPPRRNVAVVSIIALVVFVPVGLAAVHVLPVEGSFSWAQATPGDLACAQNWENRAWPSYTFPAGAWVQLHWWTNDGRAAEVNFLADGAPVLHLVPRLPSSNGYLQTSTGAVLFLATSSPVTVSVCAGSPNPGFYSSATSVVPVTVEFAGSFYANMTSTVF